MDLAADQLEMESGGSPPVSHALIRGHPTQYSWGASAFKPTFVMPQLCRYFWVTTLERQRTHLNEERRRAHTRLWCCVSHYKVIWDVCKHVSSIIIHLRHVLLLVCLPLQVNLRHALRVTCLSLCARLRRVARALVTNLIDVWATLTLIGDTPL
jgi:hypothetical protein